MMTIQKPSLPITRRTTLAGLGAGASAWRSLGAEQGSCAQTPDASLETNDVVYGTVAGVDLFLMLPGHRSDRIPARQSFWCMAAA